MVYNIAIVWRGTLKAIASGGAGGAKAGSGREGDRAFWYADGPSAALLLENSRNGVLCSSTSVAAGEGKVTRIDSRAVENDIGAVLTAHMHIHAGISTRCVVGGTTTDNRHVGVAGVKEKLSVLVRG